MKGDQKRSLFDQEDLVEDITNKLKEKDIEQWISEENLKEILRESMENYQIHKDCIVKKV